MIILTEEQIEALEAQIAETKKQRDAFVAQANQQVAHFNGEIASLQKLIGKTEPTAEEEATEEPKEKAPAEESPADA